MLPYTDCASSTNSAHLLLISLMNEAITEIADEGPARRPWWKWNVFTLLTLMLIFMGMGYATFAGLGMFIAVWFGIALWAALPALAVLAWAIWGTFCVIFGHRSRTVAWTIAIATVVAMAVSLTYLCHFAATELVWRLGGNLQYEGGSEIMNVVFIGPPEAVRKKSGETWQKRFC